MAIAAVVVAGVRAAEVPRAVAFAAGVAVLLGAARRARPDLGIRPWLLPVLLALAALGAWRGAEAIAGLHPDRLGPYTGAARLVDDPQPFGSATRVVWEVDGERFETWLRRTGHRERATGWRGGDHVTVSGRRLRLDGERVGRVAWQHVVGELRLDWVGDVAAGGPLARSANRVRATVERGAAVLPPADAALLRGLVVGDDRDQERAAVERFRAAGLSHLTAVSGQNVAYVLAAAGPLLGRLRPGWRWAVTVGLIAWFACITRFEPSILRAGVMASVSATGHLLGRDRATWRILCVTVTVLVLADPMISRSVGFWLSVGATAGVAVVGPWLAGHLRGAGPFATPLGLTLGAQLGVAVPALVVFGRLPLVSVPANLLAVPVAGAVMLYGLPAALVAGLVPAVAEVVTWPCLVGVRWVDAVATVAAHLEPPAPWPAVGWALVVTAITVVVVRRVRSVAPPW